MSSLSPEEHLKRSVEFAKTIEIEIEGALDDKIEISMIVFILMKKAHRLLGEDFP